MKARQHMHPVVIAETSSVQIPAAMFSEATRCCPLPGILASRWPCARMIPFTPNRPHFLLHPCVHCRGVSSAQRPMSRGPDPRGIGLHFDSDASVHGIAPPRAGGKRFRHEDFIDGASYPQVRCPVVSKHSPHLTCFHPNPSSAGEVHPRVLVETTAPSSMSLINLIHPRRASSSSSRPFVPFAPVRQLVPVVHLNNEEATDRFVVQASSTHCACAACASLLPPHTATSTRDHVRTLDVATTRSHLRPLPLLLELPFFFRLVANPHEAAPNCTLLTDSTRTVVASGGAPKVLSGRFQRTHSFSKAMRHVWQVPHSIKWAWTPGGRAREVSAEK